MSYEERFEIAKRVCERANRKVPVVVGGSHLTDNYITNAQYKVNGIKKFDKIVGQLLISGNIVATYEGGVKKHIEFINSIKGFATAAVFITNQICEMDEVSFSLLCDNNNKYALTNKIE